jgi:hypothetical protein
MPSSPAYGGCSEAVNKGFGELTVNLLGISASNRVIEALDHLVELECQRL